MVWLVGLIVLHGTVQMSPAGTSLPQTPVRIEPIHRTPQVVVESGGMSGEAAGRARCGKDRHYAPGSFAVMERQSRLPAQARTPELETDAV